MKAKELSDEKLIRLYVSNGKNQWIEELFGRYIRFVVAVCMKYLKDNELAQDVTMQVFEKVLADLPRFEITDFKSWIYTVSKNACMMHFRAEKKHALFSLDDTKNLNGIMEYQSLVHHNNDGSNNHEIRLQQLEFAILQLDKEQQQCVELFYLKEKSYKEVVDETGFTINQVKSYIQNGKRNLKNYLLKQGNAELLIFIMIISCYK